MNFALEPLAFALLVAASPAVRSAYAQPPNAPAAPAVRSAVSQTSKVPSAASALDGGAIKTAASLERAIVAKAERALALEHRANAVDAWTHKQYRETGYELKAAAHSLEGAAGWMGTEVKASASTTAADTRRLGDKLSSSATWTRDEVAKGFDALGNGIDAVGHRIGHAWKASPFDVGA